MLAHVATNSSCLNDSGAAGPTGSANVYLYIACVLSYLNAITNGFSLVVFVMDKKNVIMGRLLLLLSLSETVLNTGFAVNLTVMLSVMADAGQHEFSSTLTPHIITCTFFLSFAIANAFIMVRNWCLVMIAGSRCEVVSKPFSTRSGQLFSQSRSLICYSAMLTVSLLVCAPRLFEFTWTVCELAPQHRRLLNASEAAYSLTTATHHILDKESYYGHYKTLLVFPMQTIAPIFLISGLSLVIIFTLRRRRHLQHSGGSSISRNQEAATKTVMVLMFSFIICELPTFLFFILNQTIFASMKEFQSIRMHTTFLANILLSADSFTNFIIYSSTSNTFRETVRKILHLPEKRHDRGQRCNNFTMLSREGKNAARRQGAITAVAVATGPDCENPEAAPLRSHPEDFE